MATIYNDILLSDLTGDLKIVNGDFVIGDSINQNIFDIINDNKGEWSQYPNVGVGINSYINGSDTFILSQNIKIQLGKDGFNVNKIDISIDPQTSKMVINPNAIRP